MAAALRGQRLVGAAHHGVLLVHDDRHAAAVGGIERRDRRIAAKADGDLGLDAADDLGGLAHAAPDGPEGPRQRDRVLRAEGRRRDRMHLACREMTGETLGAVVGREMHLPAALDHLMRKRLGREKMPARAACREKDRPFRHPPTPPPACGRACARRRPSCASPAGGASARAPCPWRWRSRSATSRHRR